MIEFLKKYKKTVAMLVGLLDIFAGILSFQNGSNTEGVLFVSLGAMFIVDALE